MSKYNKPNIVIPDRHLVVRLDEEGLERLGFYDAGKNMIDRTKWRLKIPYYSFELQITIGNYPATNPNCGVMSIYSPTEKAETYKQTKKHPKGKKITLKIKEMEQPIAWYIWDYDRLRNLIVSLTQVNL